RSHPEAAGSHRRPNVASSDTSRRAREQRAAAPGHASTAPSRRSSEERDGRRRGRSVRLAVRPRLAFTSRGHDLRLNGLVFPTRAHRQQSDEEGAEHRLHTEAEERHAERGWILVGQGTETAVRPPHEDREQHARPGEAERQPEQQAVFEVEATAEPLEQHIVLVEVRERVHAREEPELDDLRADQRQRDEGEHRVDLPRPPEDVHRAAREHDHPGEAEQDQDAARDEVEPARAVEQHEADVPPRVADAAELRLAGARVVVDRKLAHAQPASERLEHHLGGELHSRRVEVERRQRRAAERAHPAVRVGHLDAEQPVQQSGQDRVADPAVRPRHRAFVDAAPEPRAEDEIRAFLERVHERRQVRDRIRAVRVGHDDVVALCLRDTREVRAAVAAPRLVDDGRAVLHGDLGRAVRRAVVDDDHLPGPAGALDPGPRLVHDRSHGRLLVKTGDHHRDLRRHAPEYACRPGYLLPVRALGEAGLRLARSASALAEAKWAVAVVFAVALGAWWLEAIVIPLNGGRDLGTYLGAYVQLFQAHPIDLGFVLGRTPISALVVGGLLQFAGGALAEAVVSLLYAGSIVAWFLAARTFGGRAALLTVIGLLLYPGYGILF